MHVAHKHLRPARENLARILALPLRVHEFDVSNPRPSIRRRRQLGFAAPGGPYRGDRNLSRAIHAGDDRAFEVRSSRTDQ